MVAARFFDLDLTATSRFLTRGHEGFAGPSSDRPATTAWNEPSEPRVASSDSPTRTHGSPTGRVTSVRTTAQRAHRAAYDSDLPPARTHGSPTGRVTSVRTTAQRAHRAAYDSDLPTPTPGPSSDLGSDSNPENPVAVCREGVLMPSATICLVEPYVIAPKQPLISTAPATTVGSDHAARDLTQLPLVRHQAEQLPCQSYCA